MKVNNNLNNNSTNITLDLCDCSNIQDLKITNEKTKFIVQGQSYCKIYEKIKDVCMSYDKDKNMVTMTTDLDTIEKILGKPMQKLKIEKILKDVHTLSIHQNNKNLWKTLARTSSNTLNTIENNLNKINHVAYNSNIINLSNTHALNNTVITKKTIEIIKKSIGGLIFDTNSNFITDFDFTAATNVSQNSIENLVISDIAPKQEKNLKFPYKHIKMMRSIMKISNTRLFIYYPTSEVITKLIKLIENGLEKPKFIWIVFPSNFNENNFLNWTDLLSLLFWTTGKYTLFNQSINSIDFISSRNTQNKAPIVGVDTGTNIDTNPIVNKIANTANAPTNQIIIEKIKYKLSELEKELLNEITTENVTMLDKLYFYNLGSKKTNKSDLYNKCDCKECPICCTSLEKNENKITYMPCDHMFCTACVMETIKINKCCPICRKVSNFSGIIIPKLKSNKMATFEKLLNKLYCKSTDTNYITLVYTDTFTLAKKIVTVLNKNKNTIIKGHCNLVNKDMITNIETNTKILVCPVDNDLMCKNIRGISNVIIFTTTDYALKSESLGYDYCYGNSNIKVWLFSCVDCVNVENKCC